MARETGDSRSITDANYILQVAPRICPYHLHSNISATIFALPYVCIAATVQGGFSAIVANGDFQGFREKSVAAASSVQSPETFHSGPQ